MFRNAYQHTLLTVFYSCGSKPLAIWETHIKDGYISKIMDEDIKSTVVEIGGTNVSTTYIVCPKGNGSLAITIPFLVMIVKNLKKYFTFEVTALDESNIKRRFRVSNFQSTTQILPTCTVMPIGLSEGWNQIQFNLAEFMRRAYKTQFVEVVKLRINANIRLRRIYFTERLLPEDQLPPEYKLYFPLASSGAKDKKVMKENVDPSTSGAPAVLKEIKEDEKVIKGSKTSIHSKKLSQANGFEVAPKRSLSKGLSVGEPVKISESVSKRLSISQAEKPLESAVEVSGEIAGVVGAEAAGGMASEAVLKGGDLVGAGTEETSMALDTERTEAGTEATSEAATEAPAETFGEALGESPGDARSDSIGEAPAESFGEAPIEAPGVALGDAPGEALGDAPGEALSATAAETAAEATNEALGEALGEAFQAPEDANEAPTEAPIEAPTEATSDITTEATFQITTEVNTEVTNEVTTEVTTEALA